MALLEAESSTLAPSLRGDGDGDGCGTGFGLIMMWLFRIVLDVMANHPRNEAEVLRRKLLVVGRGFQIFKD